MSTKGHEDGCNRTREEITLALEFEGDMGEDGLRTTGGASMCQVVDILVVGRRMLQRSGPLPGAACQPIRLIMSKGHAACAAWRGLAASRRVTSNGGSSCRRGGKRRVCPPLTYAALPRGVRVASSVHRSCPRIAAAGCSLARPPGPLILQRSRVAVEMGPACCPDEAAWSSALESRCVFCSSSPTCVCSWCDGHARSVRVRTRADDDDVAGGAASQNANTPKRPQHMQCVDIPHDSRGG